MRKFVITHSRGPIRTVVALCAAIRIINAPVDGGRLLVDAHVAGEADEAHGGEVAHEVRNHRIDALADHLSRGKCRIQQAQQHTHGSFLPRGRRTTSTGERGLHTASCTALTANREMLISIEPRKQERRREGTSAWQNGGMGDLKKPRKPPGIARTHVHAHGVAGGTLEAEVNVAACDCCGDALQLAEPSGGGEDATEVLEPSRILDPRLDLGCLHSRRQSHHRRPRHPVRENRRLGAPTELDRPRTPVCARNQRALRGRHRHSAWQGERCVPVWKYRHSSYHRYTSQD